MGEHFTTVQIEKALGLSRPRFREWLSREYIVPSIHKSEGERDPNIFSRTDVYTVALFRHLLERLNISRRYAGQMLYLWNNRVYQLQEDPQKISYIIFKWYAFHAWRDDAMQHSRFVGQTNCEICFDNKPEEPLMLDMELGMVTTTLYSPETRNDIKSMEPTGRGEWSDILIINLSSLIKDVDKELDIIS